MNFNPFSWHILSSLMKLPQLILLSSFTVLMGMSGLTNARSIVIGYQTNIEPAKVAQADGVYDKAIGQKAGLAFI